MELSRDNHFVPQMYLKAWSQGSKVWSYPLVVSDSRVPVWKKESIKNTAFRKDIYIRANGNSEIDDIEHFFDREIETPAMMPLKKAIEGDLLDEGDLNKLIRFVAAQCVRTPAWYLRNYPNWIKTLPSVFENTLNDISKELLEISTADALSSLSSVRNDELSSLLPIKVTRTGIRDNENELLSVKSIIGKGMWHFSMMRFVNNTYKVLMEHDWKIISAAPGISWPTSDDPVICLNYYGKDNYDFGGGWGKKRCEIIFPISPNKVLYTLIGEKTMIDQFDLKMSQLVEKLIIEHAHRKIYSITPKDKVRRIRERIESATVYNDEMNEFDNWHSGYMESEKEYMQHSKSKLNKN